MPDIHIHIDQSGDPTLLAGIDRKLDAVLEGLAFNIQQEEQTMLDLSALQTVVEYDTSVDESTKALILALADQIDSAPDQAAIDAIVEGMRTKTDDMAAFVSANTPAAPDPTTPTDPNAPGEEPVPEP